MTAMVAALLCFLLYAWRFGFAAQSSTTSVSQQGPGNGNNDSASRSRTSEAQAIGGARDPLVLCWLTAVAVLANQFDSSRSADTVVTSGAGFENVIEAATLGIVGMYALMRLMRGRYPLDNLGLLLIMPFPFLASFSAVWSTYPFLSLARGLEMVALGLLGTATIAVARSSGGLAVLTSVLKGFIVLVVLFCLIGFALGTTSDGRYTWPGAHPGVAGTLSALGLIVVLSGVAGFIGRFWAFGAGLTLSGMLFLSQTRSAIAAFLVACALLGWVSIDRRPSIARRVLLVIVLIASGLVAWLSLDRVLDVIARQEKVAQLGEFNGRRGLAEFLADRIVEDGRSWIGYGFNASRTVLYERFEWAGTAHNGLLQAYADLGYIGALCVIAVCAGTAFSLWRLAPSPMRRGASVLACVLFVSATASDALVLPTPFFVILVFVMCSVSILRHPLPGDYSVRMHDGRYRPILAPGRVRAG